MTHTIRLAVILALLSLPASAPAETLKPETVEAWDAYLKQAKDDMQARLQPGAHFLWLDDQPDIAESIHRNGPHISPATKQIPRKVPSGLIHDWLGVGFIPNVKIDDILQIVRDYNQYKVIYTPGVADSAAHGSDGVKDLFSMRLVNKSVVAKTAINVEGEASYIRVDEHHCYGFSNAIEIHEIEKFGTPEQRTLPEGQGVGLIWRLSSFTRLEERDGGVYAELEAIALSRDIPFALRLFATPIVRRVSRDSLATSLHQTKVAIDAMLSKRTAPAAGQ